MNNKSKTIDHKYMKWVEKFLKDKGNFSSDFYKFNRNLFNSQDIENIKELEYFFRIIEAYAEQNDIMPTIYEGNTFLVKTFELKYKNKIYDIGYISEESTTYTFSETTKNSDENVIDFEKLLTQRKKVKGITSYNKQKSVRTRGINYEK